MKSIFDDAIYIALDITGGPRIPLTPIPQNDYVGGRIYPYAMLIRLQHFSYRTHHNTRSGTIRPRQLQMIAFKGLKYLEGGRGERIRTSDLAVPNRTRYQTALRPDKNANPSLI